MDQTEFANLGKALSNALNAVTSARLTTQSLQTALSDPAKVPANFLDLLSGCQGAHTQAATAATRFINALGAPEISILNNAGPSLQALIQLLGQKASPLIQQKLPDKPEDVLSLKGVLADLLQADANAENLLRDMSAALATLLVLHPEYSKSGQSTVVQRYVDNSNVGAGILVALLIVGVLIWLAWYISGTTLQDLSRLDVARGLLTLLVVGTTVVVGIVIVLGMWLGDGDDESERKFLRSKEVFSILMATSGTILGFYYGSDKGTPALNKLQVSPIVVSRIPDEHDKAIVTATVSGGKPPYSFTFQSSVANLNVSTPVAANGSTILYTFPVVPTNPEPSVTLFITDAATNQVSEEAKIPK